jgi:acetyltransferase
MSQNELQLPGGKFQRRVPLPDGTELCIRPLRADDRDREVKFLGSLSERSRYMRLMTPLRYLSPHLLDQLLDVDGMKRVALVATIMLHDEESIIGVGRYATTDEPGSVELGICVADAWQHRGIATLLIGELLRYAQERGVRSVIGLVLPDNAAMLALARKLGFVIHFDRQKCLMSIARDPSIGAGPMQTPST